MTDEEKREQVAKQCDVVVHLAQSLAAVHGDYASMIRAGGLVSILDMVGERTAGIMEQIGDILNGMDAGDEKADGWTHPVFVAAQKLWPQKVS